MKKKFITLFLLNYFITFPAYSNNVNIYLNYKVPNNFTSIKKNISSGCLFESPYNKKCMSYWTQFHEFFISRGNFSVEYLDLNRGNANTEILCLITKSKLKYVTNPYSIDKLFLDNEEMVEYHYNLKFSWYIEKNSFTQKKYFYILNTKVQIEFTSSQQHLDVQLEKDCHQQVTKAILDLNGTLLTQS